MSEKQRSHDVTVDSASALSTLDDDRVLEEIGYVPSFKREFSNLATVRSYSPVFCSLVLHMC
jgi:hypothetical protein